jgi:hypothetical protein
MSRTATTNTLSSADAKPAHETALGKVPIGAIVATNWVAHQSGPSPEAEDVFEAVALGLIERTHDWFPTGRGRAALREHGWL